MTTQNDASNQSRYYVFDGAELLSSRWAELRQQLTVMRDPWSAILNYLDLQHAQLVGTPAIALQRERLRDDCASRKSLNELIPSMDSFVEEAERTRRQLLQIDEDQAAMFRSPW